MWVLDLAVTVVVLGGGLAGIGVLATRDWVRRRRAAAAPPARDPDADLYACPERLDAIERQLLERLAAVREQEARIGALRAEVAGKAGREDLVRKYDQDALLLARRAASMERVAGDLWRTRSILRLRAHLAATARRRPELGALPDPEGRGVDPHVAAARFRDAAATVRDWVALIDTRAAELARMVPEFPAALGDDPGLRAGVDAELGAVSAAYASLREDMDRLADTLTWLREHCASLALVRGGPPGRGARAEPAADPAHLLQEVAMAMDGVAALARAVDPALAEAAVDGLASDVSRLELDGREAEAEAQAHLEVERLLRGLPA